jgi:hypothetical protein
MLSPISSSSPRRVLPFSTSNAPASQVSQPSSVAPVDSFEGSAPIVNTKQNADPMAGFMEQFVAAIFGALKSIFSGLLAKLTGGSDKEKQPKVDGAKQQAKGHEKRAHEKSAPKKAKGKDKSEKASKDKSGKASSTQKKLAKAGMAAAKGMGGYSSQGLCATGVSRAISNAMGVSVSGNGNQIDNNLPRSKFKEVHMSLAQALKIPGLVLTWEKTSTAAGSKYGHTAITTGDGHTSCSDFIERDTLAGSSGRTGLKIFMPR